MKKLLSFCIISITLLDVQAQQKVNPTIKIGYSSPKVAKDAGSTQGLTDQTKKVRKVTEVFPSTLGAKEKVGFTEYDLQTNGSMQRRILTNGNNVSVTWTFSSEAAPTATSTYADRGTGYAHFNGTTWSAAPNARLESLRTGFSSLTLDGAGNEIAICHDGNNALQMNKKTGGTWTTTPMTTNATNQGIWPHTAASGNWLYILTSPLDSNIHSNGIRNGYFFSRSNDNGATWLDNMIPLPMVDSVGHYRGGGNSYAVSAQGNKVAILVGDIGTDLTLLSSVDNGATWTKKIIWDWPLNNFDFAAAAMTDVNADNIPDTLESNDGSQSMVMDANGDIHIAFPVVRIYKTGANTGYNYFYTTALAYYNSIFDSLKVVDNIFNIYHDCDGDNQFGIGNLYGGSDVTSPGAVYNSIGTITMPSISIVSGTPQKVLIAYTAIMDNDTTVDDPSHITWYGASQFEGQNYRDIFVAVSPDNGTNWNPYPVNVSKTAHFEEAFVSTPEIISGADLNMVYQGDIEPGTIMQNNDTYDDVLKNLIIVQKIAISQLLTLSLDSTSPCGQSELPLGTKDIVNNETGIIGLYPNPANNYVNVSMQFLSPVEQVDIQLLNIAGNKLWSQTLNGVKESTTLIDTKSLAAGFYIVKIITDKGTTVRRLIKE